MAWQWTPYTPAPLIASVTFLALAGYIYARRTRFSSRPVVWTAFLGYVLAGAVWSGAYAVQLSSSELGAKLVWSRLGWAGFSVNVFCWLVLILAYTGKRKWLTWRHLGTLAVLPATVVAVALSGFGMDVVATNLALETADGYTLLEWEPGPLAGIFIAYVQLTVFGSFALLGHLLIRTDGIHRKQVGTILVAGLIPFLGALASLVGFSPAENADVTPVYIMSTALLVTWALARYRFLDIKPVARDEVLSEWGDGFMVLDTHDRVVKANGTAVDLSAADSSGELLGTSAGQALETAPELLEALRSGQDRVEFEVTLDDDRRFYDASISSRSDPAGTPLGNVVILRDITIQRERENALKRERERLDDFASVVSHDLRNPLAVANAHTVLLDDVVDDHPDGADSVAAIERALDRMETIIDDLLTLAREGAAVGELEPTDVERVAKRAWSSVDTRSATVTIDDVGTVESDPRRLQELFENLYRNAVEHGGETVHVSVGRLESGFFVEDDGPGIPPEDRDDVFEKGHTTSEDGTGFGLAIVSQIAEAHGWDVRLTEGTAGGARFEFLADGQHTTDGDRRSSVSAP